MEERCKSQSCMECWAHEFRNVNSPKYDDFTDGQCMYFCGAPQAVQFSTPKKIHGTEFCVLNRRNLPW